MDACVFPLEGLWSSLQRFALSTSGHVEPHEGVSLGWLAGAVAGLAVLFGGSGQARADWCYGIPEGQCGWVCLGTECPDGEPGTLAREYYHSVGDGCIPLGNYRCGSC